MTDYYFLKKREDCMSFDICVEHFIDTGEISDRRLKDHESVRLCYVKDTDKFIGRFLNERSEVLSSFQKNAFELLEHKQDNDYDVLNAKNYARYKKGIISRYQKLINEEYERAKAKGR